MFAYFFPDTFVFLVESRGLGKEFLERDKIIICNFDKGGERCRYLGIRRFMFLSK